MPVRGKSYLRAILARVQMRLSDHRPVQAWNQAPPEQCSSGTASNRQRIQLLAPQIVAFPRRRLCQRVSYLFPYLCPCKPLQDVPRRWQLFFSPTGITHLCSSSSPRVLLYALASGHGWIQALPPASCSTEVSSSSLRKPQRETSL